MHANLTHVEPGGRALVLLVGAAAWLIGCGASEPALLYPGLSDKPPAAPSRPLLDASPPTDWHKRSEASMAASARAFVSEGHMLGGRFHAEILTNEIAREPYGKLAPGQRLPLGSVIVMRHREAEKPGPTFGMEKREPGYFPEGGDWHYVLIDAEGQAQEQGRLPLCARCHAEGASDWLFGPPHEARPAQ